MGNAEKAGTQSSAQQELVEKRRHARTQKYGPQELAVTFTEGGLERTIPVILWDFSEGGLGMESPRPFAPGDVLAVRGELHGPDYSMAIQARARVAYSRRVESDLYRIGVAFVDVTYHRLDVPPEE